MTGAVEIHIYFQCTSTLTQFLDSSICHTYTVKRERKLAKTTQIDPVTRITNVQFRFQLNYLVTDTFTKM